MEDTNKTLALLLVAAIIVSLGGTIVSLNKLGTISYTGRATSDDSGFVQLEVEDQTSIAFTVATVDFGTGYVDSSCDNCTMYSDSATGSGGTDAACCKNQWNSTSGASDFRTGLWIENDGNTPLTVNLNSSADAASFIGGTSITPEFQWKITADSSAAGCNGGACTNDDTIASCGGSWQDTSWTNVSIIDKTVCAAFGFDPLDSKDEAAIDFRVVVPLDASPGQKQATITLTGTSS